MTRKLVAVLSGFVLACGLMPITALAEEPTEGSASVQLEPGTYVEHEAIAYVVDSANNGIMPFSLGGDLLSDAEELMPISAEAASEALGDNAASAADASTPATASARAASSSAQPSNGRLVLVRDDSMTTEELIAALEDDPRVAFAEPNAYVEGSDVDTLDAQEESGDQSTSIDSSSNSEAGSSDGPSSESAIEPAESDNQLAADANGLATEGSQLEASSDQRETNLDQQDTEASAGEESSARFGEDLPDAASDFTAYQWGFGNSGKMSGVSSDEAVDMRSAEWESQQPDESLEKIVVAVIDSGVDGSNPDIVPVLWDEGLTSGIELKGGEDAHGFAANSSLDSTTGIVDYHGTHVAGIIGAAWNGTGVSGIASNVEIMAVRHSDTLSSLLACIDYVGRARDAGVDVRVTNNSWALGQFQSRSIDLAITALGEKGVTSVFGSGNSATDNDGAQSVVTTLADNPYVVVADAIDPSGAVAVYSQYGETTTDVMAPGSTILSTWGGCTGVGNYLGELDQDPVIYESFDDASEYDENVGWKGEAGLGLTRLDGSVAGQVTADGPAFDGDAAYTVSYKGPDEPYLYLLTTPVDLSDVEGKPQYLSLHCSMINTETTVACQVVVSVRLVAETGCAWAQIVPSVSGFTEWSTARFDLGGQAVGMTADGQQVPIEQLTADMIDWDNFQIMISCAVVPLSLTGGVSDTGSTPVACDMVFDGIGLGSDLTPYGYDQGTSMASPAVAGAAAAIAGTGAAEVADDPAKSAEKLAALVCGAAQPDARYEGLCSTGGFATVDGASDPGPAITKVVDDGENVKVQGWFMSEAAQVTLGGAAAQVTSCADLGDGKVELTVAKPDSFAGGQAVVRVDENGKHSCQSANLGESTSARYYDQTDLPVPDELSEWGAWQLVGYAGDIFCLPRTALSDLDQAHASLLKYDLDTASWTSVAFPNADMLAQAGLACVVDATAATFDGDLVMLLGDSAGASAFFSYSQERVLKGEDPWEPLGTAFPLSESAPFASTLASDGEALYLFGGLYGSVSGASAEGAYVQRVGSDWQSLEYVGTLAAARIRPQVSYGNDMFLVSGGAGMSGSIQMGGIAGAELVAWTSESIDIDTGEILPSELQGSMLDFSAFSAQTGQLAFASGAVADGFMIAGPVNDADTADTYKLALPDEELSLYCDADGVPLRASQMTLLSPAAVAYEGQFYVLAGTQNEPYRAFSATAVETVAQPGDYVASGPEPEPGSDPEPAPSPEVGSDPDTGSGSTLKKLANTGDSIIAPFALLGAAAGAASVAVVARMGKRDGRFSSFCRRAR